MFKSQFIPFSFTKLKVWVDLGFLGIKKIISASSIEIPHKASKHHPLSQKQKAENCILSTTRVIIENVIAMLKRYFILRIENRMRLKHKLDEAVEICASLWNFKRKCKLIKTTH